MKSKKINRRDFLTKTSAGLVGASAALMPSIGSNSTDASGAGKFRIKEYRVLGRTGFKVSDIGCGPGNISNDNVLKAAIDSGINFIDTAEFYGNGNNESMIGRVMKEVDRKSVFLNTKLIIKEGDSSENIVLRIRKCMERMGTDYLDGVMLWNPASRSAVKNRSFHQAYEQLKSEGRVRYCGLSSHGSNWNEEPKETMEQIIGTAVEDGRFDMALFVYNYVQQEMGKNILKACKSKNIGTLLMKTDPFGGAYLAVLEMVKNYQSQNRAIPDDYQAIYNTIIDKQKKAEDYLQKHQLLDNSVRRDAAISFVLNDELVNSVLITFKNFEDINDYVLLSGSRLTSQNNTVIESLTSSCAHLYCRHACGLCESSCPSNVPVNTIMRYNHYFMAQAREKYAISKYYQLGERIAAKCADCPGYCEQNCPYGVPVQKLLTVAHNNLSLNIC